jgi:hypothetical protein
MSLTQNEKIRQVTETTMVIGVDIASETHWARAFDWRGLELGEVISFENSAEGFQQFTRWASELAMNEQKDYVVVGAEPTGHYWFTLAVYLQNNGAKLVLVNPYHVKRSKELDDNHPSKSDRKDPKTITSYTTPFTATYAGLPSLPLYLDNSAVVNVLVSMGCGLFVLALFCSLCTSIDRLDIFLLRRFNNLFLTQEFDVVYRQSIDSFISFRLSFIIFMKISLSLMHHSPYTVIRF